MKEKYTTPEMEIIEFEVEDIITASGDPDELPTIKQFSEEGSKGNKNIQGAWIIPGFCELKRKENMKSKKIIAAILAVAMMVTSIQLPPVQVSAEEAVPEELEYVDKIDDSDDRIVYTEPLASVDRNNQLYYGGTEAGANDSNAKATFYFYGNVISVIGTLHNQGGTFDLMIDGTLKAEGVSTYCEGDNQYQQEFVTVDGLTLGIHKVELLIAGNGWVSLDAFEFGRVSEIDSETLMKNAWANSEKNPAGVNDGPATWAFDDEAHWWHSRYSGDKAAHEVDSGKPTEENPIWIQTGFNEPWYITSIDYTVRTDGTTGQPKDYAIYVANSTKSKEELTDEDFGEPITSGTLSSVAQGATHTIELEKAVLATHVRIEVTSVYQGSNADDMYVAAKNISIFGYEDTPGVDKIELLSVIEEANDIDKTLYFKENDESKEVSEAFRTALVAAETVYETYGAEQEAVNEAKNTLRSAVDALKLAKREFNPTILAGNAKANSEQDPAEGSDGPAEYAFDDPTLETWWHSLWKNNGNNGKPSETNRIWIQTGFGKEWYVESIVYTGRSNRQGLINSYEIYVANEIDESGDPIFEAEPIQTGNLEAIATPQTITLNQVTKATHIRIVVTDAHNGYDANGADIGDGHVAAKNISIFGYDSLGRVELQNAIDAAEALDEERYCEEYYADVKVALATAKTLLDDGNASLADIDAAAAALRTAIDNLVEKTTLRKFNSTILATNAMANSEQKDANGNGHTNGTDGPAAWAFDDPTNKTWWHSRHTGTKLEGEVDSGIVTDTNSIWIQTGFNKKWNVSYIEYRPRDNGHNQIGKYEISVLNLEEPTPKPPVDAKWEVVTTGELTASNSTHRIDLGKVVEATHIRITALSKVGGGSGHVTAMNISVFGYDELPEIEVSRNELYDVIAEAEALYYEADRLSEADGIDPAHVDATHLDAFNAVKSAADAGKAVVEDADADEIARQKEAILNAMNALRAIYLDNSEAKLSGNSLTLKGTIDVNFFMTISEEVRTAEGAYLNFTIDREGTENDETWTELLAGKTSAEGKPSNVYLFNVGMPIKDMDTEIKVQIIIPGKGATGNTEAIAERKGLVYTYSVADYIESAKTNPGGILGTEDPDEITEFTNLVNTMSDFGDFATAYFAKGKVEDEAMLNKINNVTKEKLKGYEEAATIPATREIYYGSSLLLKADTELRHYFNEEVKIVSVTVDGEDVASDRYAIEQKKGTSKWYLEYTGIGAHELGNAIAVTVKTMDDETSVTIEYSPLTYAYIALANEKEDTKNLADLMRAMYLYQQAAVDYNN